MQESLRESEARWRALVDHSLDGILLTALSGQVLSANPAACRMLDRSEEQICREGRKPVVDLSDERLAELLAQRARTGFASGELTLLRGDGSQCQAQVSSAVFEDANGQLRTSMSLHDLTARKQREREQAALLATLRESEERFRLTFEYAPIGMALVGLDGRWLRVNQRLCEIVGFSAEELTGLRFQDITHPEDLETDLALLQAVIRGEVPRYELAKRYLRKDGAVVETLLHVSVVRDERGAPQMFVSQIVDVTERKRLEAQLALADKLASVGTLASGVAHEINNPLTYVITNLELIADELREAARAAPSSLLREVLRKSEEARLGAQRVRKIVRGLKTFSRADEEQRRPVDPRATFEAALEIAHNEIRHRARLVWSLGPLPLVVADESKLVQVFVNLLLNAAQAIPEERAEPGEIRVASYADEEGRAVVEVADTGVGMPEELRKRIFDPFFTTKDVGVGTGLGLFVSHAIVTAIGGVIEVESRLGEGSVFRVRLPAAAHTLAQAGLSTSPPAAQPSAQGPRGRVLVIDDDEFVARVLHRVLVHDHEVTVLGSGHDAVVRLEAGDRFDAILCDLMMPDLTGPDVYREVERIAPEQAARMVFVTGGAFTASARAFLERVTNPRLEKPIDKERLRAVVREVVAAVKR